MSNFNEFVLDLHCDLCILNGDADLTSCPCKCHKGEINFD